MNLYADGLTIGQLARRTGVGVPTLRAWEARHGFPVPRRLPSGHRRYSEHDVEALRQVLAARADGPTLEAALVRARRRADAPRSSILATLRRTLPDVAPVTLSRRSMLAVSHAIEFEAASRAESPLLIGAFQHERFWRAAAARWRDLSVRATAAVVLATLPRRSHRGNVWEVPLPANAPLTREWAVVCDSPTFAACLVGVERPGRGAGRVATRFEALWTIEPPAVRAVASTALGFAADLEPDVAELAAAYRDGRGPASPADVARNATALTNRLLATFDALVDRRK